MSRDARDSGASYVDADRKGWMVDGRARDTAIATSAAARTHSQPVEYFTAPPTQSQAPRAPDGVRSLLPADAAKNAEPKTPPIAGLEADDPRNEVIEQGYQVRDIDRQVNALADQQIDIEGAKARVQAAQGRAREISHASDGWADVAAESAS